MSKIQDAFPAIGRQLFEHEKEHVAKFNSKYSEQLATWTQAPYNPPGIKGTLKTRHIVPQWLYENVGDIVQRVHDFEAFMHKNTWVANDLQVNCSADLFESIKNDDMFKLSYQWYTNNPEGVAIESGEQWLKKKRWVRISRTLFVVEE